MEGVFINYRRDDSSGWANRLHRDLVERFGADRVFRDLNLEPGINFKEAIGERLRQCRVQLVLIGRQWLTITDSKGRVRIQKADDLVRAEIAIALASKITVIPVLVQDADMPTAEELPEDIRELAELNAVELSDRRWDHDTKGLMEVVGRILGIAQAKPDPEPQGAVPRRSPGLPPNHDKSPMSVVLPRWGLWAGGLGAILGIAFLLWAGAAQWVRGPAPSPPSVQKYPGTCVFLMFERIESGPAESLELQAAGSGFLLSLGSRLGNLVAVLDGVVAKQSIEVAIMALGPGKPGQRFEDRPVADRSSSSFVVDPGSRFISITRVPAGDSRYRLQLRHVSEAEFEQFWGNADFDFPPQCGSRPGVRWWQESSVPEPKLEVAPSS